MKARKITSVLAAFLAVFSITACGPVDPSTPTTAPTEPSTSTTAPSSPDTGTSATDPNLKTNDDFEKARTTYVGKDNKEYPLTRNTLYTNSGDPHLDSTAPQRVLVVPFGFGNGKYDETEERLKKINTVFFGTDEEMASLGAWKSVAGYYTESSYGKA